jgi:hypothetical protein
MASKNLSVTATSPPSKEFDPEDDANRTNTSEESQEMTLFVQDLLEQMVREKLRPPLLTTILLRCLCSTRSFPFS